MLNIMQMLQLF